MFNRIHTYTYIYVCVCVRVRVRVCVCGCVRNVYNTKAIFAADGLSYNHRTVIVCQSGQDH